MLAGDINILNLLVKIVLWAELLKCSTDFQNVYSTFSDAKSVKFCIENILPTVKEIRIP